MGIVKLVVMARGLGTRMRQGDEHETSLTEVQRRAAAEGHKALMPLEQGQAGVVLDYLLSRAADAGLRDVCLVVSPDHEAFQRHYHPSRLTRLALHYAVQPEPTGTAHAVLAAREWSAGDDCVVVNGDNLYPVEALRAMANGAGVALGAFTARTLMSGSTGWPRERLSGFALVQTGADGTLEALVEKPDASTLDRAGDSALISMNLWRIDASVFEACADVPVSTRGEYELPAAVMLAMRRGARVAVPRVDGPVLDVSRRADIPMVQRALAGERPRL